MALNFAELNAGNLYTLQVRVSTNTHTKKKPCASSRHFLSPSSYEHKTRTSEVQNTQRAAPGCFRQINRTVKQLSKHVYESNKDDAIRIGVLSAVDSTAISCAPLPFLTVTSARFLSRNV